VGCGDGVVIRTGIILPTFRPTPDEAFEVARRAVAAGVDGLFCYDHIWPMGQPERPALAPFPLLAALVATLDGGDLGRDGPFVGTLVARVGLVPNQVLVNQFLALEHLAPGRVIAGLGTGDRLSAEENVAYGIPVPLAAERRAELVEVARTLKASGLTVWVAGGLAARLEEVRAADAVLNVWDAEPQVVVERSSGPDRVEVTWAGPPPKGDDELRATVRGLAEAGASWVVFGWPVDPDVLVAAAGVAG
jgi:alkanesulfonate monooxygenase SsuD/methylene tetrahydromethanopterin reductase-like flavin-dependent oxidoreductase (luciferase family)